MPREEGVLFVELVKVHPIWSVGFCNAVH